MSGDTAARRTQIVLRLGAAALVACAASVAAAGPSSSASAHLAPLYEQLFSRYPAPPRADGAAFRKAPLDWSSSRRARRYRTRLSASYAAATRPNFFGSYVLVDDIGCGAACVVLFVVDPAAGKVYDFPLDAPPEFRADSGLIILNPLSTEDDSYDACLNGRADGPPVLLEFDGLRVRRLSGTPCRP
jgi:hypothetical protein